MDERQAEKLTVDLKKLKIDVDFRSIRAMDFETKLEVFAGLIQGTNPNSRLLELISDSAGINLPSSRQSSKSFTKGDFQAAFYAILAEELQACNYSPEQLMNSKKTCYSAIDYLIQRFQFKNVQKYKQIMDHKENEARKAQEVSQEKKYARMDGQMMEEIERDEQSDSEESGRDSWFKAVQKEQEKEKQASKAQNKGVSRTLAGVLPGVQGKEDTGHGNQQQRQAGVKTTQQIAKQSIGRYKQENPHSLAQIRAQIAENPAELNLQLMYQEELLVQYQAQIRQYQKKIGQLSAATVNMYQKVKNNTSVEGEQLKKALLEFQQAREINIGEYEQDILEMKQQLRQKTRIKNQHFFNDVYQLRKILKSGNQDEITKQINVLISYYEQGDGNANLWEDVYDVNHY